MLRFKKIIIFNFFLFIISFSLVVGQDQEIYIRHVGYGESIRNVFFVIRNTGIVDLHNITIFIDGKLFDTIYGTLGPDSGIQKNFYLDSGEHIIEVKTSEGASSSVNITIPPIREKPPVDDQTSTEKSWSFLEKNKIYLSLVILVIIFVIIAWFLFRRPKLEE